MKEAKDFLADDAAKAGAEKAYGDRDKRRKLAIALREGQAKSAAGAVSTLRQQAAQNQRAIRYGASQATAMGMQPGMGGGGGAIAAAGQVGRDAEMAGIAKKAQDTDKILSAEQAAAQSAIEAQEYAAQQGDAASDYQEAYAQGQTEAEQAIQDAQGFFDDDEAGAYRTIRAVIARIRVKSPQAADELENYYLKGEGRDRIESYWD